MVKLIAIDLDGTLLDSSHQVSGVTKATLAEAKSHGVKIVLCSGRPIGGMRQYLEQLQLTDAEDYVIAYNGAFTQKTKSGEVITEISLQHDDLKELYNLSLELDTPMQYFDIETLYTPNKEISTYTVYEAYLNNIPLEYRPVDEYPSNQIITNIMYVNDPMKITQTLKNIPKHLYEKYAVAQSAPFFMEFTHPEATKGNAVKKLADKLGIKQSEIMAIGDNGNDISMIEYAGYGVAMKNAIPEVKAVAKYDTLTNNEDGVAYAVQKFVLDALKV